MLESIAYYLLAIYIFLSLVAFSKWRELSQERKLRDLVAWSATGDYSSALGRHSYIKELLITVLDAQYNDAIDKQYRITEEAEKQYVNEIIDAYQQDIMRSYFKGHLRLVKSKYVVHGEYYFMLMLYTFLSDHQCDYEFLGHKMHKKRLECKHYGDWGDPLFDAKYEQTDFAVVFHKMHYITYMYCRTNEILRGFVPEWNEKNLKEILDANQIQISST